MSSARLPVSEYPAPYIAPHQPCFASVDPAPTLAYARLNPDAQRSTRNQITLMVFGILHLLLAIPALLSFAGTISRMRLIFRATPPLQYWIVPALSATCAMLLIGVGIAILSRKPSGWRWATSLLSLNLMLSFVVIALATVVCAAFRNAKDMDGFIVLIGLVVGAGASVPFWLSVITGGILMRADSRRSFSLDIAESVKAKVWFLHVMWMLYFICGLIVFVIVKSQ